MTGRVEGKVAFITGAARGQGRSHAVRLAQEGADIIAIDVCRKIEDTTATPATPEDLAETADMVKALDRRVVTAEVDVRDYDALKAAVDGGVEQLGRLDIVVANAGIGTPGAMLEEMDEPRWEQMMDINLTGVWKSVKAAVPHVKAGGRGGSPPGPGAGRSARAARSTPARTRSTRSRASCARSGRSPPSACRSRPSSASPTTS